MVIKLLTLASAALLFGACASQNGEDLLASGGVPTPACDTSNVTYAGTVAPILQQCSGCHGGSQPAAAFAVSSYAQVRAKATSGSLLGTLNHDPGYSPMPKGGVKLSDCDLAKLRQWVAAGTPNN
jgi:mono/diheme cytochrome c family protein